VRGIRGRGWDRVLGSGVDRKSPRAARSSISAVLKDDSTREAVSPFHIQV
jgi:hypothetical protein